MEARITKKVLIIITALIVSMFLLFDVDAGRLEPTSAPAPTMHNLNEIYHNIAPAVPSNWSAMPSSPQSTGKSAIHMTIDGISGSCQVQGREDSIVVAGLEHNLSYPLNTQGQASGIREHSPISVIKYFDRSSPDLYRHLCESRLISYVALRFYRLDAQGIEEANPYYSIDLTNVHIAGIKQYFPNMEYISLSYATIKWKYEDGGIEYQDLVPGVNPG